MYETFKQLLEERKITSYQVSKDTGISQQTFSDWKHGKSKPKADKMIKLANYFGVSLEELITEKH